MKYRTKSTCWASKASSILESTNVTRVGWQGGESHSDGQSSCMVGLLPLINWILNELYSALLFFTVVLTHSCHEVRIAIILESLDVSRHLEQTWLCPNICHCSPYIPVLFTSSLDTSICYHILFPFQRVCLPWTDVLFFPQISSVPERRNAATAMRPVDASSHTNIMQRKTPLKIFKPSPLNNKHWFRSSTTATDIYNVSIVMHFLCVTCKFKPFHVLVRLNCFSDEQYFLTDWSIC